MTAPTTAPPSPFQRLSGDLARLLERSLSPAEFRAAFLQQVLETFAGIAGAVWEKGPGGDFRFGYQVDLPLVGLEALPDGRAGHAETLRLAARQGRALWVPPHSGPGAGEEGPVNRTTYGLLLAPVLVEGQPAGFVEVWVKPPADARTATAAARLLGEAAGFVAAHLYRGEVERLRGQQQVWSRLEGFVRRVHASLDPAEVARLIAHEGRQLVGCDQLAVAVRHGEKTCIEALSGAPYLEARSPLVRALRALAGAVLTWGQPLVHAGTRDESLPPDVLRALDAYLAEGAGKLLVVLPLRDERQPAGARPCAAVVAECFNPTQSVEEVRGRLDVLAGHATPALYNALAHRRIPFRRVGLAIDRLNEGLRGRGALRAGLVAAAVLLAVTGLFLIRVPLRLEAKGELLPRERRIVYAPLAGKVVELKARHGDAVERGQELLFVEDLETQLQAEQLALKVAAAEQRVAVLNEQLARATTHEERNTLLKDRLTQEYEMRKAAVERDVLLHGARNPRKTPVPAPLAGKVVTFDARERLVGRTVKPGDPLLRIAHTSGPWEVELYLPEGSIAPIRAGLDAAPDGALAVRLLLASQPHRTYGGRLRRAGLGGETTVRDNVVVLPARVEIVDRDLLTQLEGMAVGVEVRAKVDCGRHAAARVWLFDLWEFFFEHVWF